MVTGEEAAVPAVRTAGVPETGEVAGEAVITAEEGKGTIIAEEAGVFPRLVLATFLAE